MCLFIFDEGCLQAWEEVKQKLISAPIISAPYWTRPFEVMCGASEYAIGAIPVQCINNWQYVIYYASRTLNEAQLNYTTTEKEFLAVVFALEKFFQYLLRSKTTIFIDHSSLRYLMQKKDAKVRLIRWIFLLQEFNLEIMDKKGVLKMWWLITFLGFQMLKWK